MKQYLKFVILTALISLPFSGTSPSLEQQVTHEPPATITGLIAYSLPKQMQLLPASSFQTASTINTVAAAAAPTSTPVISSSVVGNCGDNSYANYIYMHESGCSLTIRNAEGCIGIGQACPASNLLAACPSLDYACENNFFTAYANSTYGGWAGAYNFWIQNKWW